MDSIVSAAGTTGKVVVARFTPGTNLVPAIQQLAQEHGIRSGIVLSCVANTRHVVLRNPPAGFRDGGPAEGNRSFLTINHPSELVSLTGNIAFREDGTPFVHLHACVSAASGPEALALGGHLEELTVMSTAEIVIAEVAGVDMIHRPTANGRTALHPEPAQ